MASAIGSIMRVVAVFEIHIDKPLVATIKPAMSLVGWFPNTASTFNAILLCKPQRSMAKAIMKPPIRRKTTEFMYWLATDFVEEIPSSGNNARGKRAVAARGTASVIHRTAIKTATAAMRATTG